MDVSHAILFLENADFVRLTGLYFPAKFELINIDNLIMSCFQVTFHTCIPSLCSGKLPLRRRVKNI